MLTIDQTIRQTSKTQSLSLEMQGPIIFTLHNVKMKLDPL